MSSAQAAAHSQPQPPKALAQDGQLLLEQVRLVHGHLPLTQIVALFNAVILTAVEWSVVEHQRLLTWLLCMTSVTLARLQVARAFQRLQPGEPDIGRWRNLLLVGVTASGALWGAAAIFLFPPESFPHQVFVSFVIAGMIAGSVATLSPLMSAFLLFAIPAMVPVAAQFLMRSGEMYFSMSVMTVIYGATMIAVARHVNSMLRTSLTLSQDNGQLVQFLTKAKAHADVLNVTLEGEVAERRLKELALRDGEALLAEAQRMAHLGSWSYDPTTRSTVWSDEAYRIYGLERSAPVPSGRALIAQVHLEDRKRVYALLKRAVRYGEPYETEFRLLGVDGRLRWIHALGQPRVDSEGRTYEVRGTVLDITERKLQEHQLDAERKVFEAIAKGAALKDVLDSLCRLLEVQGPAFGAVYLLSAEEALVETAAPSLPAEYRAATALIPLGSHPGLYAGAEEQGHAVLAADIAADARWTQHRAAALAAGLRACWAVPILGTSKPILGVIAAYFGEAREPSAHGLKLIDRIANIAKIALERDEAEQRIRQLAHYDELTGLPNRVMFNQALEHALSHARRENRGLALLFVDLDRFKNINDTLGHDAGDRLLRHMAERLKGSLREADLVARFGGDEFMVLLEDLSDSHYAAAAAEKLLAAIAQPLTLGQQEFHLSASIGISAFPDDGSDPRMLQKHADIAMYRAKERGRNCWHFYSPTTDTHSLERLKLEGDLRRALERDELELHYQPKLHMASGRVTGMEALLRWRHPELGMVPPAKFIPLAEETGLIVPIGEWVLRRAVQQAKQIQQLKLRPMSVAVNLSARQFEDESVVQLVADVLLEVGLSPSLLELEITESKVMHNIELSARLLRRLKELGVRLAMDDFGTGYSSLAYLKRFPVDTIKIDRSFIQGVPSDIDDSSLTRAIIAMAQSLRLRTVAEGVESREQMEFLRLHDCDEVQGYYFSKPLPYAQLIEKLQRHADEQHVKPAVEREALPIVVWP
jgi:diguanylate cyclase (GGDEF)-like protein/PAS domain S-box-containing protein